MSYSDVIGKTQIEVRGEKITVTVNRAGTFMADIGGETVMESTLSAVEEKAKRLTRAQKIEHAIPVVLKGKTADDFGLRLNKDEALERKYVRAILRGKNARTSQYLFTLVPDGKKIALEYPDIILLEGDITDEQLAEANRLAAATRDATNAEWNFVTAIKDTAIKAQTGAAGEIDRRHMRAHHLIEAAEKAALAVPEAAQ